MRKYYIACILMLSTALLALYLKPTKLLADQLDTLDLDKETPMVFGDWYAVDDSQAQIIEPERAAVLSYLYTQTLSRTYINNKTGMRVMLSIAYGKVQSDGKEVHKPEICYPAQGFSVSDLSNFPLKINGVDKPIQAKELIATQGARVEPILYWTTLGNYTYNSRVDKKRIDFTYALENLIPDGLLFRVSTLSDEPPKSRIMLQHFVEDLHLAIKDTKFERRLFGLGS